MKRIDNPLSFLFSARTTTDPPSNGLHRSLRSRTSPTIRAAYALAVLTLASAIVMENIGPNQTAHFATVRALAAGTPRIHREDTGDSAFVHGHYYAAKAPGLALYTLPWYEVLRAARLDSAKDERTAIWKVNLFGAILPFVALLLLMRAAVERVSPGYGVATAALLGAGTLLFPFSTLFFNHALSATLGFAAFLLLMLERDGRHRPWLLAVAGLVAGLAVVIEFPLVLVAAVLGAVYLVGRDTLARLGTYAAGFLVGTLPLLAFNTWAFGSPTTVSYAHAIEGNNQQGLYGVQVPDLRAALTLLLSAKGLFVVTPLAAVALVGLPRLWRAGRRREALVCGAIPALFLIWNAGYFIPFGGSTPGPRFLVPALPFLSLPLASALRARTLLVTGVGLVSAGVMWLATATEPMTGDRAIGVWLHLLGRSQFTDTVLTPLGTGHGWLAIAPFGLAFLGALGLALFTLPAWKIEPAELMLLAAALLSWLLLTLVASPLLPIEAGAGTRASTLAVAVLALTLGIGLSLAGSRGPLALLPLLPAAILAAPGVTTHPRWSLLVAALTLCAATATWIATAARGSNERRETA